MRRLWEKRNGVSVGGRGKFAGFMKYKVSNVFMHVSRNEFILFY